MGIVFTLTACIIRWWIAARIRCQRTLVFPAPDPQSVQANRCQLSEGPGWVRHWSHVQSGGTPGYCQRRCQRCPGGLHRSSIERTNRDGWIRRGGGGELWARWWFSLVFISPQVIRIWWREGGVYIITPYLISEHVHETDVGLSNFLWRTGKVTYIKPKQELTHCKCWFKKTKDGKYNKKKKQEDAVWIYMKSDASVNRGTMLLLWNDSCVPSWILLAMTFSTFTVKMQSVRLGLNTEMLPLLHLIRNWFAQL